MRSFSTIQKKTRSISGHKVNLASLEHYHIITLVLIKSSTAYVPRLTASLAVLITSLTKVQVLMLMDFGGFAQLCWLFNLSSQVILLLLGYSPCQSTYLVIMISAPCSRPSVFSDLHFLSCAALGYISFLSCPIHPSN